MDAGVRDTLNGFSRKWTPWVKPLKARPTARDATSRVRQIKYYLGWGEHRTGRVDHDFLELVRQPKRIGRYPHAHMMAVGVARRARARPKADPALARARHIYRCCKAISDAGRPYLWGGGHSRPLSQYRVNDDFDCSGSVGLALWLAGEYHAAWTMVSSGFESWGRPGEGRYVTIYANWEHVWIRFKVAGLAWRFDTSPHGSGGYGPRLRWGARDHATFVARHPAGL